MWAYGTYRPACLASANWIACEEGRTSILNSQMVGRGLGGVKAPRRDVSCLRQPENPGPSQRLHSWWSVPSLQRCLFPAVTHSPAKFPSGDPTQTNSCCCHRGRCAAQSYRAVWRGCTALPWEPAFTQLPRHPRLPLCCHGQRTGGEATKWA